MQIKIKFYLRNSPKGIVQERKSNLKIEMDSNRRALYQTMEKSQPISDDEEGGWPVSPTVVRIYKFTRPAGSWEFYLIIKNK